MDIVEILDKLDKGQIDFDEALTLIKSNRESDKPNSRGHFLKINIKEGERCLPPIIVPLFLIKLGLSLGKAVIKLIPKDKQSDLQEVSKILDKIDNRDLKRLVGALGQCTAYSLVRVEEGSTHVDIRIV